MKGWFDLKQNKLVSLLTALALGASALLTPGLPVLAEETSAEPETVSLEGIYALRDFLLGHGIPQGTPVLDMDQNGSLDARDLTLAKRAYLDAESEDITLRNLRADQPDILLNEETVVTFTVSAQSAGLPEKTVALYDPDSEEPAAYMYDDGTHGDETALDGIYTAQLTLVSDDFKNVDYYAAAGENKSDSFRICFYRELTDEELQGFGELLDQFDEIDDFESASAFAESSEEITSYYADADNRTISYRTIYHISGFWEDLAEEDTETAAQETAVQKPAAKLPVRTLAQSEDPENIHELFLYYTDYDDIDEQVKSMEFSPAHPDKKDVIVLVPFQNSGKQTQKRLGFADYKDGGMILGQALDSNVTIKEDYSVTIELMKQLSDYGTILICTHGGLFNFRSPEHARNTEPIIVTGVIYSDLTAVSGLFDPIFSDSTLTRLKYSADFSSERIIACRYEKRLAVAASFFDYYYEPGSLNNSFWFIAACHSMDTVPEGKISAGHQLLGEILCKKGAGCVAGMTNVSNTVYNIQFLHDCILKSMLLSAESAEKAITAFKQQYNLDSNEYYYPTNDAAFVGDPDFRLVNKIEDFTLGEEFPDDPDFVADNELVYSKYQNENGEDKYVVHGKTGNVNITIPKEHDGIEVTGIDRYGFKMAKHLRSVYIEDGNFDIPDYTFNALPELVNVHLSANTHIIGDHAFGGCSKLKNIQLPEGLREIRSNAFSRCIALTEINIPKSVESIGSSAFNSSALKSITIDCQPLDVLDNVFYNCKSLESAYLRSPVETMFATFANCPMLAHVELPVGLKSMSMVFRDTTLIREIELPEGIEEIGTFTFSYCRGLEKLIVPESVTVFGQDAVSYCPNLKSVVFPDNLTEIGSRAFYSCTALTDVQLPKNLEKLGESSFAYCTALTHIELPDSLKLIDYNAFRQCARLKLSEHLPKNVEEIRSGAFYRCSFEFEDNRSPYLVLPEQLKALDLFAFEACQVSGLVVNNPEIEFVEPYETYASLFKILAGNMWLVGHPGSTAQQFAENPDHPTRFIPIDEYQGRITP